MSFEKILSKLPSSKPVESEWRKNIETITSRINNRLRILPEEEYFRVDDKKENFIKKLHTKYGEEECRQFAMYHFLIGHSPWKNEHFDKFDFPGEDSVENFYNNLLNKN